ncbi:hypothetical protein ACFS07_20310 [Undibacterium arcticum]
MLTLTGIIALKAPLVSGWATTFFLPFGFFAFFGGCGLKTIKRCCAKC